MSFSQDEGYLAESLESIISDIRVGINDEINTTYTEETFLGTGWYKFAYAIAQRVQRGEVKTSEIFQKLQQYIVLTNQRIQRPSVSLPGLMDSFDANLYTASIKPPAEVDAGKIFVCVQLQTDDDSPSEEDQKEEIATLISQYVAAGLVWMGDEEVLVTISNGQSFTIKFYLPDETPILLRLTAVESVNNLLNVPTDQEVRQIVYDNTKARYRLGWNFEPQRYIGLTDLPWAGSAVLEYSTNGGGAWSSAVFSAAFDDLFTFGLGDVSVVIT